MTTNEQKAKFVAEKLGLCWHEVNDQLTHGGIAQCRYCGHIEELKHPYSARTPFKSNPTFTDPAGIVMLLELMMKREDWHLFVRCIGLMQCDKTDDLIEAHLITDKTGKLLDAAWSFLGGIKQ